MNSYKSAKTDMLKWIPNPTRDDYETKLAVPEFTCLGAEDQPDFGRIFITMHANKRVIELKSLKQYFYQYRNIHISYERLVNLVYDHLIATYTPKRLRIVIEFFPRGGISSRVAIDSDWKVRGGDEQFWHLDADNEWKGTR